VLAKLLEAIFGIREGKSWIDLDDRMRGQLRFWGAMSVLALLVLIISSLYFYVQWPPLRTLVDSMWKDVQESVEEKGEIPKWIVRVGGWCVAGIFMAALIRFYFLVNFGKLHYRIDSLTLRIIPRVNQYIRFAMLTRLGCPPNPDCALHRFVQTRAGARQFMNEVFYHFANRDTVGSHNQADKRRQVFAFWTKYYVFNYVMVIVLLAWLWMCFVVLIKASAWIACLLIIAATPILALWWWRGRYYRQGAVDLAADQINAFVSHANEQVVAQAAGLIAHCSYGACRVRTTGLAAI